MQSEKFKVTPLERSWILYDVGNSAFVLMIATLVPIFFNALAEAGGLSPVNYLAYWGYASSVVTVITAVLGPILGTLADTRGFKKPIFMLCLFVGVAGCCAMGLATTWMPFLRLRRWLRSIRHDISSWLLPLPEGERLCRSCLWPLQTSWSVHRHPFCRWW